MGFSVWKALFSQFLLTFTILSAIGLGVCAVGVGWSSLRRSRRTR